MAFLVKLDEDLSMLAASPLIDAGYDVRTVIAQRWGGLKDEVLFPLVKESDEFFVTGDKGFGDIRLFPPGSHPGIVLLRPDRDSVIEYRDCSRYLLGKYQLPSLRRCLTVVTNRAIRVRRPSS